MNSLYYSACYEPDEVEAMLPPKIEVENEDSEDEVEIPVLTNWKYKLKYPFIVKNLNFNQN
jgi:hypothetical protein